MNGSTSADEMDTIEVNGRLATLVRELAGESGADPAAAEAGETGGRHRAHDWRRGRAGRLVERWVPGGTSGVERVRSATARRPVWAIVVVGVAVVAAIVTAVLAVGQRPAAESAPPLPVALDTSAAPGHPVSTPIVVSVVGKVMSPGLVELPSGSRVADAVRAAGGAQLGADLVALNLARRLSDGEQIYVGIPVPPGASAESVGEGSPDMSSTGAVAAPDAAGVSGSASGKGKKAKKEAGGSARIDLNHASIDQLEQLPGVGPATAQRIVTWRTRHGRFTSVDQLRDVGGIGAAKLAKLRNLVSV